MSKKKSNRKKVKHSNNGKLVIFLSSIIYHLADCFFLDPISEALKKTSTYQSIVKSCEVLILAIEQLLHEMFSLFLSYI